MIQLTDTVTNPVVLEKAVKRFREKGILLPTFSQMQHPELVPEKIRDRLLNTGLWDLDPVNLFRITWKNEPVAKGGLFGKVNFLEIPSTLTGAGCSIVLLLGKWFPTGAHKVGAAYGCLAPKIITGGFDPEENKAVWPSTGNYCRGGAFDSYLMGCIAVAILPEEMSEERFLWLKEVGAEIIATRGCESNVKEIYDKCWEIRKSRPDCIIFNQFDEFGNPAWHYHVTGPAIEEVFTTHFPDRYHFAAFVSATGSAGTIAAGDYLKTRFPGMKTVASEALQCPTLLQNGFGGHRIEGIGDKHVPWVHNVRNTDVVAAIDDEDCMRLFRLFNEQAGKKILVEAGNDPVLVEKLELLGISGIANLLAAVKTAKYYELDNQDIVVSIATDSAGMYRSRLEELRQSRGQYDAQQAIRDLEGCLYGQRTDHLKELTFTEKRAIHNLKYFTWVEQQGKNVEDLYQLWSDRTIWDKLFNQVEQWDILITEFNVRTGLLK